MTKKEWLSLIILAAVLIFAVFRYHNRLFSETKTRIMMGTLVEVSLTSPQTKLAGIIDSTFALISDYERILSYYDTTSELWQINNSDQDSIAISKEIYEMLELAQRYYDKTSGRFDVTISPLTDLWHSNRTTIPPADSIRAAMALVGFDKLEFTSEYLKMPVGMRLNLGGIAKGYIIDKAVEYALDKGVLYGHINAGGDIRLFGSNKRVSRIGIRHPRDPNSMIAVLSLTDKAVVTSGDYEKYFEVDGEIYHHIINPLTGYPVENVFSVTIVADNATIADALSTSVFLMDADEAIDLIKNVAGADGIIYYQEDESIVSLRTEGIRQYLSGED